MQARLAFLLAAGALACLSSGAALADGSPKTVDGGSADAGSADGGKPVDDPMVACMAAAQKALDLEKVGKLLDARTQLAVCAAPACGQYVAPACQKRIGDLGAKLSSILFHPKDSEGSELQGVQMSVDGGDAVTLDGKPVTLDPGPHTFHFEALGLRPSERTFVLVEGAKGREEQVIVGVTEAPPAAASAPAEGAPPPTAEGTPPAGADASAAPAPTASAPAETNPGAAPVATGGPSFHRPGDSVPDGGTKVPAYVVGGVGVLGVAIGSVLGGMAISDWSSSKSDCSSTLCTASLRPKAVNEHDSAKTEAAASSVAFGLGAAAFAVSAYLYFTAPERTKNDHSTTSLVVEPSLSPAFAGLSMHGAFR